MGFGLSVKHSIFLVKSWPQNNFFTYLKSKTTSSHLDFPLASLTSANNPKSLIYLPKVKKQHHQQKNYQQQKAHSPTLFLNSIRHSPTHMTPGLCNFSAASSPFHIVSLMLLWTYYTRTTLTLESLGTKVWVCPICQLWTSAVFIISISLTKIQHYNSDLTLKESVLNLNFITVKYHKAEKLKLQLTVCLAGPRCINKIHFFALK